MQCLFDSLLDALIVKAARRGVSADGWNCDSLPGIASLPVARNRYNRHLQFVWSALHVLMNCVIDVAYNEKFF